MPKPEYEFFIPDNIPWQPADPVVKGLHVKILAHDPATQATEEAAPSTQNDRPR